MVLGIHGAMIVKHYSKIVRIVQANLLVYDDYFMWQITDITSYYGKEISFFPFVFGTIMGVFIGVFSRFQCIRFYITNFLTEVEVNLKNNQILMYGRCFEFCWNSKVKEMRESEGALIPKGKITSVTLGTQSASLWFCLHGIGLWLHYLFSLVFAYQKSSNHPLCAIIERFTLWDLSSNICLYWKKSTLHLLYR